MDSVTRTLAALWCFLMFTAFVAGILSVFIKDGTHTAKGIAGLVMLATSFAFSIAVYRGKIIAIRAAKVLLCIILAALQSCILSRTDAGAEKYQKPEQKAKGYTWYIRLSPTCGEGIIAYFKDVEDAVETMETLKIFEHDNEVLPSNDDLKGLRRQIMEIHSWPSVASLQSETPPC